MTLSSTKVLNSLHTIRDFIRWGASRFVEAGLNFGQGTATALDEAAALTLFSLKMPYNLSEFYLQSALTLEEKQAVVAVFEKRINQRIPAAYVTNEAIFAGLSFFVDERVLIPRSPIAELIEQHFEPWLEGAEVGRILDLCTGSGCIAIACAYAFPEAKIDAVDISAHAIAVAEINVAKHHVGEQVILHWSNLYEDLPNAKYDIIVSNPPYVSLAEWKDLPREFHAEPEIGFVAGNSGLDIVLQILVNAGKYLNPQGILVVEVGSGAEALQQKLPNVPFYWLEFERGGDGVFLLSAEQVAEHQADFTEALS